MMDKLHSNYSLSSRSSDIDQELQQLLRKLTNMSRMGASEEEYSQLISEISQLQRRRANASNNLYRRRGLQEAG